MEEVINKCVKIHERLPAGDILVFLTGEKEIKNCAKLLTSKLNERKRIA